MNILYVSFMAEDSEFVKIFTDSKVKPGQQVQKFNSLLAKGLANNGYNVTALSTVPISRSTSSRLWVRGQKISSNNIEYNHIGFVNIPVLKQICVSIAGYIRALRWAITTKGSKVIICDTIAVTLSGLSVRLGRMTGITTVGLITDLPDFLDMGQDERDSLSLTRRLYINRSKDALDRYSAYILLTQQMNDVVNEQSKPYIVMEGMVDSAISVQENDAQNKIDPPVVLYAGALFEKYGLRMLLDAFVDVTAESQLYIYGDGDMAEDFGRAAAEHDNIKYFGVVSNDKVVSMENFATLLVNPRMSTQEFAKYSFPSKNMEYMLSGTPVLTCNLPGMPQEYREYVYILEDESVQALTKKLDEILSQDRNTLHQKGHRAKEYVYKNKSNTMQALRIGEFIKEIICTEVQKGI